MRLFHKLLLLISLSAMLSALAVAGVLAWNLERGFSDYLDARDAELLDQFVAEFDTRLSEAVTAPDITPDKAEFRTIAEQMARDSRISGGPSGARRGPPPSAPDESISSSRRPPPVGARRGPPPDAFGTRLRILDGQGELVIGPPSAGLDMAAQSLTRVIETGGMRLATVELLPRGPTPRSIDANFLQSQYSGLIAITAILLVLSALAAFILARAGVRRISALDDVTNAVAAGDLAARVNVRGSDEIAAMGNNINTMAASLETLEGARRRWLAEISHELRTPLTVLTGELAALSNGIRPLNIPAVQSLSEEVDHLNNLIEDLHLLAVSDLGKPPMSFVSTDAVAIINEAATRFAPALNQEGLELVCETGFRTELPVVWDRKRIDQVLANLITNSARYTDSPGVVRMGLLAENDLVLMTIEDSPPGVPEGQHELLFEPLYRLEQARDRISGGSGLGLSVAKAIVDAHGGSVVASSSHQGGLKIEIQLPLDASTR